ncbi:MauE/DoxX family redox-associated membrane protein [Rosistilla oblonga]|uniref:DoxX n=1 Tax=Rosistilla oblonga TaxID=2527990 RepID=A0A518J165_9BACT|nr:MauE/DoxX family redox-associated membrane protein [Rosistilla oblonga]QDV59084.1 hypothetical protein Mal33_51090 [Rosistilla oblonga]
MSTSDPKLRPQLALCLLLIRLGITSVFLMWTIDKFVNPEHAAAVFKKFYMVPSLSSSLAYGIGAIQLAVVIAFALGAFRNITYPIILILHSISTFSSFKQYADPWTYPHLLFFAAIPMLAACFTLWLLRRYDDYSIDAVRSRGSAAATTTTPGDGTAG